MPRPRPQPQLPIKKRRKPGPIPRLKGMVKTSTVMTEAILEGLDTLARQTGKSRADLLRVAAEEMLERAGIFPSQERRKRETDRRDDDDDQVVVGSDRVQPGGE